MFKSLNAPITKFNHYKQIDILRAIAVIGVIVYHFGDSVLVGGWLGVDVFFVISGFLISNTIISSIENNTFTIKEFYKRRAKRILPSLFSTILITLPMSFQLLAPKELIEYLRTVVSSLLFYSNFFLLNLDFYNTSSAQLMPLIHTWSLSIEEQFYIIFPLFVISIYKIKIKNIFNLLFTFFCISFVYAFFIDSDVAFYLPQFRIWEFLLGVILMQIAHNRKFKNFSNIALIIILFSFIYFDDSLVNEMLPRVICLFGTSIYLLSLTHSYSTKYAYQRNLIFIGKISYSLYLFHQPVYSFYKIYLYKFGILESKISIILLIIFLFLISFANYIFVEKKYMTREKGIKNFILIYCFTSFLFLGFMTNNEKINQINPLHNRLVIYGLKSQNIIQQNSMSCENRDVTSTCYFDTSFTNKKVYSLGDSSLRTISYLIEKERENLNFDYIHFGGNGCMPILNNKITKDSCPNKDVLEMGKFIKSIENSIVIYGGRLPLYLSKEGFDNGIEKEDEQIETIVDVKRELKTTLKHLNDNQNIVILIYPIPTQGWNVPNLFFYNKFKWGDTVSYNRSIWEERVSESKLFYDSIVGENIIRVFPENILCESFVKNQCVGAINGEIFYSDDDHLSIMGASYISELILSSLEKSLDE